MIRSRYRFARPASLEEATALEAGLDEAALELAGAAPEPDPLTVKSMQDS